MMKTWNETTGSTVQAGYLMEHQDIDKLAHELVESMDKDDVVELARSLDALYRLMRLQVH